MNQLAVIPPSSSFSMGDVEKIANAIAKSGMFGLKDPYAILTLCLLAQAEGQHPAVVFRDYSVISGKPAKKAEAMLRDFITSGGKVEWHALTDECADATFMHPAGTARISWDKERAKKAGLGGNGMYAKYPRQMLRSRVISEGVRTVFPGATSGLYVPEEVQAFEPKGGEPQHDEITGEIIEPKPERQKVPGIHKIKERLSKLLKEGDAATDLDAFNALVKEHKDDLKTIRDANHEWWTGDGEDFEGYAAWKERRKAELTPGETSLAYQLLVSTLNECESIQGLQSWLGKNGDQVEMLDGEDSRRFEMLYSQKEAGLKLVAQANA